MAENEKKKYNIKVNPKKPSAKTIQSKMDFEGAYSAYTHKVYRTPWSKFQRHAYKNRKISMYIILAIIVGIILFTENEKDAPREDNPNSAQDSTHVKKQDTIPPYEMKK